MYLARPELLQSIVLSLRQGSDLHNVDWEAVATQLATRWRARKLPPSTSKTLQEVDVVQSWYISRWLRLHGQPVKPRLTEQQARDLRLCYNLIDLDKGGSIDVDELDTAFKLLGIDCTRQEMEQMMAEVDYDGSGEVEYPEFIEIMTSSLAKLQESKRQGTNKGTHHQQCNHAPPGSAQQTSVLSDTLPFDLIALRYTRKRLIECLIHGDHDTVVAIEKTRDEMTLAQPAVTTLDSPETMLRAGSFVRLPTRRLRTAHSASRHGRPRTAALPLPAPPRRKAGTTLQPPPHPLGLLPRRHRQGLLGHLLCGGMADLHAAVRAAAHGRVVAAAPVAAPARMGSLQLLAAKQERYMARYRMSSSSNTSKRSE